MMKWKRRYYIILDAALNRKESKERVLVHCWKLWEPQIRGWSLTCSTSVELWMLLSKQLGPQHQPVPWGNYAFKHMLAGPYGAFRRTGDLKFKYRQLNVGKCNSDVTQLLLSFGLCLPCTPHTVGLEWCTPTHPHTHTHTLFFSTPSRTLNRWSSSVDLFSGPWRERVSLYDSCLCVQLLKEKLFVAITHFELND